ncbi:MAG TPA: hypothetical protein PKV72_02150 [Candidatus Peribacteria bacterium]|nr:hypothetical protein [Candidatus Peribacteria bacterium]
MRALAARKPAQRKPASVRARLGTSDDWLLERRDCPAVTNFAIEPLPDNHLTPGQHGVPVLQFTAKGTDWRSALSTLVVDDAKQGILKNVRNATLSYESSPGNWTPLDSSPVSTPYGGRIGFNGFGWVPVGDLDGAHFRVSVDTIDAAFTPVHGELDIVAANVRYGGTPTYSGVTSPGDNHEEFPTATVGGPQRTIFHIVDLSDAQKTVNANSRDQTVFELYENASDSRAYANCMRFMTKDASALPFVRTATFYREISPGVWHAMMTVRPNAYGQLIFTVYQVHQQFRTSGMVHLQVRVNTDPAMVGNQKIDLAWYKSTSPYAGQMSFDVLELNAPLPPVTHGMLSTGPLFYAANPGQNTVLADINIGGNEWSYFDRLDAHVGSGTFAGATNFRLYALDANDNPTGPALGIVTFLDNGNLTISGIGFTIHWSQKFRLIADLTNFVQLGSVTAQG